MKSRILLFFVLAGLTMSSAPPALHVYVNGREINTVRNKVMAEVKMHGKYFTILKNRKSIVLHDSVMYQDISQFRFIINCDTIVFKSENMLAHLKNVRGGNKID